VHHPQVHPPGLFLAFAAVERFYDRFPAAEAAVARWVERTDPSTEMLRREAKALVVHHPAAFGMTLAYGTILLGSLTPLACFVVLRQAWPAKPSLVAAGLSALVPGAYLFNPSLDQAYPTLTLLLCAVAVRAVATRRQPSQGLRRAGWRWGIAFGVLAYGAMFLHIGFALVVFILGVAAAILWRSERPELGLRDVARAWGPPALGAIVGFLTPAFVLQVWVGYPTFRVILLCLRNNGLFNAAVHRTYWPWVAIAPFEFALSLGFGLLLVSGVGWLLEAGRAVRRGSLQGRSAVLLAAGGVMLTLHLLGMNRGETARLWLFLTPLLVIGGVETVWRQAKEPRWLLGALACSQLLQAMAFSVALDAGRTTTFFTEMVKP
jgi:hypothetical protein